MISFYVDYENKWKSMQDKHLRKQKNNGKIKKLFFMPDYELSVLLLKKQTNFKLPVNLWLLTSLSEVCKFPEKAALAVC